MVSLLILLVGFNQFISLLFNKYFSKIIAGFGDVLLGLIQSVSTQVILWVITIAGGVLLFGLILLLSARFTKEEAKAFSTKKEPEEIGKENNHIEKAVMPETLEEIEEKEKSLNNKRIKN